MTDLGLSLPLANTRSSGIKQWWANGASMALDFTINKAMKNGSNFNVNNLISCTRATTGTAKDNTGNDITFGINELRITDKGLYIYQADGGTDADEIEFIDISWFNPSLGTFLFEWEQIVPGTGRQTLMRWQGTTDAGSSIWAQVRSGNYVMMQLWDTAPTLIFNNGMWSAPALGIHKVASAIGTNNMAFVRSTSLDNNIDTDTNGTPFSECNSIVLGGAVSDHFLNGWLRSITYWPTRLSDIKLQELVS